MVATQLTLLSLAVVSSCMFGTFRGEARVGRLVRRLEISGGKSSLGSAAASNGTPMGEEGITSARAVSEPEETASSSSSVPDNSAVLVSLEPAVSTIYPLPTSSASLAIEYLDPTVLTTGSTGGAHITDFEKATQTTLFAQVTVPAAQPAPAPPGKAATGKTAGEGSDDWTTSLPRYGSIEPPSTLAAKLAPANAKKPPPLPSKPSLGNSTTTTSRNMSRTLSSTSQGLGPLPTRNPLDIVSSLPTISLPLESFTFPDPITMPGLTLPPLTIPTISFGSWVTIMPTTTTKTVTAPTDPAHSGISYCQASDLDKPSTTYSIVYSTTITWTGDPNEYTAPFPPLITPKPSCIEPPKQPPIRYTLSRCNGTETDTEYRTCEFSTTTVYDVVTGRPVATTSGRDKGKGATTVLVTDKNPAVIFPTSSLPDYGGAGRGGGTKYRDKVPAGNNPTPVTKGPNGSGGQGSGGSTPTAPITVSLRPGAVTLNDQTYTDNPVLRTQIAHVGGQWFTIDPTRVIGAGTTLNRPTAGAGPAPKTPITTAVGGAPVVISSDVVVVDGTSFSLDGPSRTKVVQDKTLAIGPGGIDITSPTQTTHLARLARHTEVVVAGGEVVTAIGGSVVVIRGTTITYGPSTPITKMVIYGDEVTIGPMGVVVRNTILGGTSARESDTKYEVVGGATITQVAPSIVIIAGSTYTVGPGSPQTTIVVREQTITLGPAGVAVSTITLAYPFGETSTAVTITPGATAVGAASATGSHSVGDDGKGNGSGGREEDAAAGTRPSGVFFSFSLFCIASGVLIWVI